MREQETSQFTCSIATAICGGRPPTMEDLKLELTGLGVLPHFNNCPHGDIIGGESSGNLFDRHCDLWGTAAAAAGTKGTACMYCDSFSGDSYAALKNAFEDNCLEKDPEEQEQLFHLLGVGNDVSWENFLDSTDCWKNPNCKGIRDLALGLVVAVLYLWDPTPLTAHFPPLAAAVHVNAISWAPGNEMTFTVKEARELGLFWQHPRSLCIAAEVRGVILSRVCMDNGSAFNVMPHRTFDALGYTPNDLTPGNAEMGGFGRAVTGTSRGVVQAHLKLGNLDSEEVVTMALFHVLDTQSDYELLLGRPWMVDHRAIPSTAHWKVKLPFRSRGRDGILTIEGEP